jgi:hypothetical protein
VIQDIPDGISKKQSSDWQRMASLPGQERAGVAATAGGVWQERGRNVKTSLVASELKNPLLIKLDQAHRALAEARTIEETKMVRDVAKAATDLMKQQQLSKEAVRDGMELRMQAEHKLGEFLTENVEHTGGGDRKSVSDHPTPIRDIPAGISRQQSSDWQWIASIPEETFEEYLRTANEPTTAGAVRLAKELERQATRSKNEELVQQKAPALPQERYSTIVIDPPWDWGDEGDVSQFGRGDPTYATMLIEEIAALPVGLLAKTNAHLYLWITNRSLPTKTVSACCHTHSGYNSPSGCRWVGSMPISASSAAASLASGSVSISRMRSPTVAFGK